MMQMRYITAHFSRRFRGARLAPGMPKEIELENFFLAKPRIGKCVVTM
jgi:hypothetical protein